MNQKEYKEIVGIIKSTSIDTNLGRLIEPHLFVKRIADYFEREYEELEYKWEDENPFNHQQFLKDCGVK